ncbi:MAG: hypothetical protein ACQ5SW_08515 [Sphaerochaetaceae bacterium]
MKYHVIIPSKINRKLKTKIPKKIIELFVRLIDDIEENGPEQPDWMNYSKLGEYTYHCHLNYSWVAVWRCENDTITLEVDEYKKEEKVKVEVEYVGSRENAPYDS